MTQGLGKEEAKTAGIAGSQLYPFDDLTWIKPGTL